MDRADKVLSHHHLRLKMMIGERRDFNARIIGGFGNTSVSLKIFSTSSKFKKKRLSKPIRSSVKHCEGKFHSIARIFREKSTRTGGIRMCTGGGG